MHRILTLVFFAAMVFMNYLANSLPINGKTTGELSDAYPNLFVPAGVSFSIWGIIYMLLAIYCVLQFTPASKATALQINGLFILSCVFNGLWIVAWHYQKLSWSLLIMIGLLLCLILINLRISEFSSGWVKAAFGIYLGWICIATIANVTALLVDTDWEGFGIQQYIWTIIMIVAGTGIATLALLKTNNPFVGLSVIWAFAGIIIKRSDDYRSIVITAIIGILIVGVFTVSGFLGLKTQG